MPSAATPEGLAFLRELAQNNTREWFTAQKNRFEHDLREPLLAFVEALAPRIGAIDPSVACDAKSVFRIYRDTRFAKDKSPYKTNLGAHFTPRQPGKGRDETVHLPGYYLHIEPGGCFFGAGTWRPDGPSLARIRGAMEAQPAAWTRARDAAAPLGGEQLQRVPKGYAADHPLADDLRRKDFVAMRQYEETMLCREDFLDDFVADCARVLPMVQFLARAVGA